MRKTVIALMLILPLLFVFAIFSSVNIASLGVNIAVSGISIVNKSTFINDTLRIDLADRSEHFLDVEVYPENATNKGYSYKVEQIEGSQFADVSVSADGVITAKSEGAARIYAVSNDGGYRDGITVLVGSSKAYDFLFSMYDASGDEVTFGDDGNYSANVSSGRYSFSTKIFPSGFTWVNVEATDGIMEIDSAFRSILLPFSGKAVFTVTVPDGVNGDIVKTVTLNVTKRQTASGITINGEAGNIIAVERGAKKASFYVESDENPSLEIVNGIQDVDVKEVKANCYIVSVAFERENDFSLELTAGTAKTELMFTFKDFDFSLSADLPITESGYSLSTSILSGVPVSFYAASAVPADVTYTWGVESADFDDNILSLSDNGAVCKVSADKNGSFILWVEAYRDGAPTGLVKEVSVSVISRVYGVQIVNNLSADLAARYTVGGLKYDKLGKIEQNKYLLDVRTFYEASGNSEGEGISGVSDLDYSILGSNATLSIDEDKVWLTPQGTGAVTVSFSWKGNATFGTNYTSAVTLNVVRNGVEVSTSSELIKAANDGMEIVLTDDIMLGTDDSGEVLPIDVRRNMLGKCKSTYNIEWYVGSGSESDAYVNYVLEFKDNVYGNGHFINAEYFTNALDAYGVPQLYRGPLKFVSLGDVASVAGQDNCAFLIRTDGVKLYGVNLLGCSDESLRGEMGNDLSKLNNVGTVLEVNASAEIVNCRIKNGRNVVRAYGGNQSGDKYFIDSLSDNNGADGERINVKIEGCIISQGREFLLKVGANRALRASKDVVGTVEPDLLDANGKPYLCQTNNYLNDKFFYNSYVMTDITLKDSVLETSGLFAIGMESNFSGTMLYKGLESPIGGTEAWVGTGGTSFASVLRLEGDVRLYDWKDISLVDSSTLIESSAGAIKDWLRLDVSAMIDFVQSNNPKYQDIIKNVDGKKYVHGGIAIYGGGKNYCQISTDNLDASLSDFTRYNINISTLEGSDNSSLQSQGQLLPGAAGKQDFVFYMYNADSANSYEKQLNDGEVGGKYSGIKPLSAF
ncbi:MAG: hypothetical protein J1F36_02075 [Clostridiales bacterium]|nr:hypothetical protein [Clostridiales bacterium]